MGPIIRLSCVAGSFVALAVTGGCYVGISDCCCRPDHHAAAEAREEPGPATKGEASCGAAAVSQKEPGEIEPRNPLFKRLGGLEAVEAVVDDFLGRLTKDPRIMGNRNVAKRLAAIHVPSLRQHVVNQICKAAGGPCKYTGRDMKSAHAGLAITEAEWDAAVDDLVVTLDHLKVPEQEQDEVLRILGPLKDDIVGQ